MRARTILTALIAVTALAATASAQAIVFRDARCFIPGVDASGNLRGSLGAQSDKNQGNRNGNIGRIVCHGTVQNLSGKTQVFKGIRAFSPQPDGGGAVLTDDTVLTITKKGRATFVIRKKAD